VHRKPAAGRDAGTEWSLSMNNCIVLAYSGGLDTSVMITWLREHYRMPVVAVIVDVGQKDNFALIARRAKDTGAVRTYILDARREFVEQYISRAVKANAVYENKYLLGTSLARPLIAQKVVEVARKEKARYLAHGATGKGNDQVRFELAFQYLYPEAKTIAPWREWDLVSREDEVRFARKHRIPVPVTKQKPYSSDPNYWHISYEGGVLEDLENAPREDMFSMTVSPMKAPQQPQDIELGFTRGVVSRLTCGGKTWTDQVRIVEQLNQIGGKHGIGRTDVVENRLVGIKSRGVYEAPAATIMYAAHREVEALVLDRATAHYKERVGLDYAELIYNGLWFTPLRVAMDAFIDHTQEYVTGSVSLRLYKGTVSVLARSSPHALYKMKLASFDHAGAGLLTYRQKDAEGFINLFGLPYKVVGLRNGRRG